MKIQQFLDIVFEIKNAKFDLHGVVGTLTASNSTAKYYWQIIIEHRYNLNGNYAYALIKFDLRVNDTQFYLDAKEIAFSSLDQYLEFAKTEFVRQINNVEIYINEE